MIEIKTPRKYISEEKCLHKIGSLVQELKCTRAFLITGNTAWEVAGDEISQSLTQADIPYTIATLEGEPSQNKIDQFGALIIAHQIDIILAIGGGKVLDLAKAVREQGRDMPIITVPTIAATCAAWTALSVLYHEDGSFDRYWWLKKCPDIVITDISILAKAPARYLRAGIGDSIVKWYEFAPQQQKSPQDMALACSLATAKLLMEVFQRSDRRAVADNEKQKGSSALQEVIDGVIMLAGLAGGITDSEFSRPALAHGFHDSVSFFPEVHGKLHGEKVAFGLLVQACLAETSLAEIQTLIEYLAWLQMPINLSDLGFKSNYPEVAAQIAERFPVPKEKWKLFDFAISYQQIEQSILKAHNLGTDYYQRQ